MLRLIAVIFLMTLQSAEARHRRDMSPKAVACRAEARETFPPKIVPIEPRIVNGQTITGQKNENLSLNRAHYRECMKRASVN